MMHNPPHILFSHNPLFQLASAFAAGIVFAARFQLKLTYLVVGLVMTTTAAVFSACIGRVRIAGISLLSAMFFASYCLTVLQARTPSDQLKTLIARGMLHPSEPIAFTGVVTGPVELARDGIHFSLNVDTIDTPSESIKCAGVVAISGYCKNADEQRVYQELDLHSGSHITVRTKLDRTEQYRNPGVSTLAEYLDTKDLDAVATIRGPESIIRASESSGPAISATLYRWRGFLQRQIDSHFSIETAGVLAAALLGNRYNLSIATAQRFREGGTFHILVISGAHITFLGAVILLISRRLTSRRWLQLGGSVCAVWLYTLAVGADPSVVRAALMFSFVAVGIVLFRKSSPLNSLSAAALVLLVWSPKDLFNPSLQLTFLSVLAIVLIALPILQNLAHMGAWRPTRTRPYPPECSRLLRAVSEALYWSEDDWQREQKRLNHNYRAFKTPVAHWLERHHLQRPTRYLFASVVVSVAVQLMLLPFQIVYFHRLSPSSLILNVVVGILLTILAAVALLAVLIAQVSTTLASLFVALANTIDWLMVHSVDPFTHFGLASCRLPEYAGAGRVVYVIYYLPLIVLALLLTRWQPIRSRGLDRSRSSRQEQEKARGRDSSQGQALRKRHGAGMATVVVVQIFMFLIVVLHPFSAQSTNGMLRIDFLDVGQGDSALVTMPNGATLLVDGGGKPQFLNSPSLNRQRSIGEMVVCEYLWYRGLDSVDYVLATHADADHIEGLNDVVANFKVRAALVARTPTNDLEYQQFAQTLKRTSTPVQLVQTGDLLRFGDVEAEVLWPPSISNADAPSRNNDSLVIRIRYGERKLLLTGDIEKTAEAFLSQPDMVGAEVVKVPHHGSRTSSTEAFVSAVQPKLAVISVGQQSMFGHPHPEVVQRWRSIGAEVLTTGNSGMITVVTDGKSLSVTKFVRE
ncbi:MAG TPA: ComEC/Rec2 family competence protein [Pyrinomonadaceae bacterium]